MPDVYHASAFSSSRLHPPFASTPYSLLHNPPVELPEALWELLANCLESPDSHSHSTQHLRGFSFFHTHVSSLGWRPSLSLSLSLSFSLSLSLSLALSLSSMATFCPYTTAGSRRGRDIKMIHAWLDSPPATHSSPYSYFFLYYYAVLCI